MLSMIRNADVKGGGSSVYWSITAEFDRGLVKAGLANIGLAHRTPQPRTDEAALAHALRGVYNDTKKYSVVAKEKQSDDGFEVMGIQRGKGAQRNQYSLTATYKVGPAGVEHVDGSGQELGRVRTAYMEAKACITHSAVGKSLVDLVTLDLGGVSLRPHGGIYWVPGSGMETLDKFGQVLSMSRTSGRCDIYRLTSVMDVETVKAVRDALADEVAKEITELEQDMAKPETGKRALINRQKHAEAVMAKLKDYESILGQSLKQMMEPMERAEQSLTEAVFTRYGAELIGAQ